MSPSDIKEALCVDAACSGNPGKMEYRGVHLPSGRIVFHFGPIKGTNNIGEFLAIVHALAWMKQKKVSYPVYSDSVNAQKWVREKKCKTKLEPNDKNAYLFELIARAEKWLNENPIEVPVMKWRTEIWGEIPADFGRK
jgi:ribonuclease HI